jgi:hypothetical protein
VSYTPPDELEDKLFLAMLRRSRDGSGPDFNLKDICALDRIPASDEQLIAFVRDHDGVYGSKNLTFDYIYFSLNAEGHRHAIEIEKSRRPLSFTDRLADEKFQKIGNLSISALSLLISLGALVVAIFALAKGQ